MSLSGSCHIVLFVYCRGRNKQQHGSFQEKEQDDIMVTDKHKRQANVILLIATHVIFVKIIIYININWIHVFHIDAFDTVVHWEVLIL